MSITSKFVFAKTKEAFEREKQNIPAGLDPIVFIKDTKELWTNGIYFNIGSSEVSVSELDGDVIVNIGDDSFTLQTIGDGLSISKGLNNNIVFSSNDLSFINTEDPLEWEGETKKLLHKKSGVDIGIYGSEDQLNVSSFYIPNITVSEYGHITDIKNSSISIRDYVVQMSPTSVNVDRNILLSFNENSGNTDTNQVRKASGLLYNDYTKILSLAGGLTTNSDITINSGDLNVLDGFIVGDVQGNFYGLLQNSLTLSINGSDVVYNNGIEQLLTFYAPITSGTTGNNYYLTPITNGAPVWQKADDLIIQNSTKLITSGAVYTAINNVIAEADAMVYKGVLDATSSGLPAANKGDTYKVSVAGNFNNTKTVEVGDMLICNTDNTAAVDYNNINISSWNNWDVIQTNLITSTAGLNLLNLSNPVSTSLISVTADGTASANYTLSGTGNVVALTTNPTFIGDISFKHSIDETDIFKISPNSTNTNSFTGILTWNDLTTCRTWTLPDSDGTIALSEEVDNKFAAIKKEIVLTKTGNNGYVYPSVFPADRNYTISGYRLGSNAQDFSVTINSVNYTKSNIVGAVLGQGIELILNDVTIKTGYTVGNVILTLLWQ